MTLYGASEQLDPKDSEHPQWKRRRRWNGAGAATGLATFLAMAAVKIIDPTAQVSGELGVAAGLFLVSSGIYVATALLRNR